ncbi:hypothetical protein [Kitasatospora sp. NPDC001683]
MTWIHRSTRTTVDHPPHPTIGSPTSRRLAVRRHQPATPPGATVDAARRCGPAAPSGSAWPFDGSQTAGASYDPHPDARGTTVVFTSEDGTLVPGDTDKAADVLARRLPR